MKYFVLLFVVVIGLAACKKDKLDITPTPYKLDIPSHFPQMQIPADNPMTVEGVELGRRLFYEKKLSLDNTISCASCHHAENSFSDPNTFSIGVNGAVGNRQSMALINMGWQQFFFWDGRAKTLEQQLLEPIPNPVEMNQSWEAAIAKLSADVSYRNAFFAAFGESGIDKFKVAKALAQFIRTMISGNSKYDVMYKYQNSLPLNSKEQQVFSSITPEEWAGYDLFLSLNGADCFHCHNGPLVQVEKFSNNGLDAVFTDLGREHVTGNINDRGKFKVPTLRNIALSAPYMHDGRFATLDEVIEHYSSGIKVTPTIDPLIEFANQGGVQLDSEQKYLLKKFLETLTDYDFVNNPAFKKPE
jgi:cytochrome c peroxidase